VDDVYSKIRVSPPTTGTTSESTQNGSKTPNKHKEMQVQREANMKKVEWRTKIKEQKTKKENTARRTRPAQW